MLGRDVTKLIIHIHEPRFDLRDQGTHLLVASHVAELRDDTPSGELVACPRGHPAAHFHTGVHLRPTDDGEAWIAVFPDVVAGEYSLLSNGVEFAPFVVVGGEVTELGMVELPAALDTSC